MCFTLDPHGVGAPLCAGSITPIPLAPKFIQTSCFFNGEVIKIFHHVVDFEVLGLNATASSMLKALARPA